jgi:16S rRNA processing protein RimM
MTELTEKRVCVGIFGAPHGVRGEIRVKSETADPLALADFSPLYGEDGRVFRILSARMQGKADNMLVVRVEGIKDRTAAESLTHVKLYVERARLPDDLGDDDFYHADLIGLKARDASGKILGHICAVQNFGAGDLLEIKPSGQRAPILLPFTAAMVPEVQIRDGYVVIAPPQGLF